jgi:hypothetical protein
MLCVSCLYSPCSGILFATEDFRILIPKFYTDLNSLHLRPIFLSRTYLLKTHAIRSIGSIILRLIFKLAFFKMFHQHNLCIVSVFIPAKCTTYYSFLYFIMQNMRCAGKSLARPTLRYILFVVRTFRLTLVLLRINSVNIPPFIIINRIYENQNLLSL